MVDMSDAHPQDSQSEDSWESWKTRENRRLEKRRQKTNLRTATFRRRRAKALWLCYGVQGCYVVDYGHKCPYYPRPECCGAYRQFKKGKGLHGLPCAEERRAVEYLGRSLSVNMGLPEAVALSLAGAMLVANRNEDGKVAAQVLKSLVYLELEHLKSSRGHAGKGVLPSLAVPTELKKFLQS